MADETKTPGPGETPAPEAGDPPADPTKKGKTLENDDRQEWEIPSAELEARKQKPKRGRAPKTEKGQDTPGKGKAPKPADKGGKATEPPALPRLIRPSPATPLVAWRRRLNISTCPSCTPPR